MDRLNNITKHPRLFYIGASVEFSFCDYQEAFKKFDIKYTPLLAHCCVEVELPDKYGLLYFNDGDSTEYCASYYHIKEALEKINPGFPLVQVIFDMSDTNNMEVVLVCFNGTQGNCNSVCFEPSEKIYIVSSQISELISCGTMLASHAFNKRI
jgi:hypothetical protein